jgi:hypothetical protein
VFNVRVFPSHVVHLFFCLGIGHELGSCPYWSSQVLPSKPILVIPPNITPLPQSFIPVHVYAINTSLVVWNIYSLTTNPFKLLVPTQEVVDLNSVVPYIRTPYVISSMYVPIVEPTLMRLGVMPT